MSLTFPASFMLAAAMNPCPCGFWNDPTRECRCSPLQMQRYVGRISGPLLDRIDIHIDVPAVKFRELAGDTHPETDSSATIRARVNEARERQLIASRRKDLFKLGHDATDDSPSLSDRWDERTDARTGDDTSWSICTCLRSNPEGESHDRGILKDSEAVHSITSRRRWVIVPLIVPTGREEGSLRDE